MADAGAADTFWRRCSSCKKPIAYGDRFWRCSVSTCNRSRTALRFCSVSCWDAHLSLVRHRESWAIEERAPGSPEAARRDSAPAPAPPRGSRSPSTPSAAASGDRAPAAGRRAGPHPPRPQRAPADPSLPIEILVVASRLKHYVRARAGLQTSDKVLMPLSDHLRAIVDEAVERARAEGRSTLLARDIPPPRR